MADFPVNVVVGLASGAEGALCAGGGVVTECGDVGGGSSSTADPSGCAVLVLLSIPMGPLVWLGGMFTQCSMAGSLLAGVCGVFGWCSPGQVMTNGGVSSVLGGSVVA